MVRWIQKAQVVDECYDRTAPPMSSGPAHTLEAADDSLSAASVAADSDSCRRHAWAALDSAIRVMTDTAGTAEQRRAAFNHVQQAHSRLDEADTFPQDPNAGPQ